MNLTQAIQYYDGKKDNTGREISIDKVIRTIAGPSLKPFALNKLYSELTKVKNIDPESDATKNLQAKYDDAKGKLPAVTWAGTFTKRSIKGLKEATNLIVLDIDKLSPGEFKNLRNLLCADPYTFICYTSPSGAGIKVVFKHDGSQSHNDVFLAIEKYINEKYNIELDKSGKDISRLCFLCHDADLFLHEKSLTFSPPALQVASEPKAVKLTKVQQTDLQETDGDLYAVIYFTDKIRTYTDGSRNNYIHLFACNANRKGFSLAETLGFAVGQFADLPQSEVEATVKSAFNHNAHEHGKFKKQVKNSAAKNSSKQAENGNRRTGAGLASEKVLAAGRSSNNGQAISKNAHSQPVDQDPENTVEFWTERKIKKGKGEHSYEVTSYELKRVEFTDFLYQQGFHLLDTEAGGYQICFSRDGVIMPVEPWHIKKAVFAWCKQNAHRDIEEMLRKGQKQFFASNEMDSLHTRKIELKVDTEKESYFYFNNGWVTVSADDISIRPYSELDKYIWAGTKRKHNIEIKEPTILKADTRLDPKNMDCEFAKFVYFVSYNPNNPDEKDFDDVTVDQRFLSIVSAIGFMLDGYKHPADRKGIFAVDHKIGDMNEQNGRTGKSIIPKALEKLKVVSTISGKNFDPKYQFRYEPITVDSQIINFNDMPKGFDVESIFEVIADDYSVNRRNNGFLHFRYDNSPKPWISTNFTPKGAGDSYAARMHIIEFSDYFNAKHSPYNEFGHGMFSSAWDNDEWNRFYNFLLWCVKVFKADGLVPYPHSNFEARKLANEVNVEFIDFMDSDKVPRDTRVKKHDLLEEFNKEYQLLYGSKLKPHTFHKWLKQYCKHHGLFFNPHRQGAYDKSNGAEYYTIATTADFKPTENAQPDLFKNSSTTQTDLL